MQKTIEQWTNVIDKHISPVLVHGRLIISNLLSNKDGRIIAITDWSSSLNKIDNAFSDTSFNLLITSSLL